MNKNEVSTLGIGLGIGMLIGAVLGILYAPKSGKETRQLIKTKTNEVVRDVRGRFGHGRLEDVKS
jgi:gas vesicle protein